MGHNLGLTDDRARPKAVRGWVREGVSPSRKGIRGYNPRENVDICDARMCILECRIGIVYGDDNMTVVGFVVETGGEKEYEWTIFAFLAGNRLYPLRLGDMGER